MSGERVERFDQLDVWQKAHAWTLSIYKATDSLPDNEEFGLILRMRQTAITIPANIANGFERRNVGAKLQHYRDARAAVEELRYYLLLCRDLGYTISFDELSATGDELARMVGGLVASAARREHGSGGGGGHGGTGNQGGGQGGGRRRRRNRGRRREREGDGEDRGRRDDIPADAPEPMEDIPGPNDVE